MLIGAETMSRNRRCPCQGPNQQYLYDIPESNNVYFPEYPVWQYQDTFIPEQQDINDIYSDDYNSFAAIPTAMTQADPPPLISNNPVTANVVLRKELTAYPNYGNPSRNADILYTGNTGTWTIESPAFLFVPGRQRAQIIIRAVLDDHSNVPVNLYSARITINGIVVHNGRVPLEHGTPAGGIFTNWRDLTFNINNPRRANRITIENTSSAGPNDWIGLDWMEMRLSTR